MNIKFEDLKSGLSDHNFTLTEEDGVYKVRPAMKETPVWKFDMLSDVLAFFNGIEAQKTYGV